jgi:hypothetical protein
MQRRRWLQLGFAAAAILAAGGGLVSLVQPGLDGGRLTAAGRRVMANVARAILDGTLPTAPALNAAALAGLLVRIDTLVAGLPAHAQQELSQLLALLHSGAGRRWLAGLDQDWEVADIPAIQHALQGMRTSTSTLRQQAYHALHDICGGAYFADRSTWADLGYPGPLAVGT